MLSLIRPLKKYEHYVNRANLFEILFMKKRAIVTMEKAVQQSFSKGEIASGYIYLGLLESKIKDDNKAANHFEKGLEMGRELNFEYSPNFDVAIKTFIKSAKSNKANYWLEHLLSRKKHDKKFSKLEYLKNQLQK